MKPISLPAVYEPQFYPPGYITCSERWWRRFKKMKKLSLFVIIFMFVASSVWAVDITFTWNPNSESDLAGYKLYMGDKAGGPYTVVDDIELIELNDVTQPSWVYTNLPAQRSYFVLTAYDTEGLESGFSNEVSVNSPPGNPSNLKIQN